MRDFAKLAERISRERREQHDRLKPLVSECRQAAQSLRAGATTHREGLAILRAQANLIRRIPGYFPTPAPLADRMVAAADLHDGLTTIEPSAGDGAIARAIRRAGYEPILIERDSALRELLTKQGFNLVAADFLAYQGAADRILMNPPFENLADVDHVQHAFSLLKPRGLIVAVMSESAFFNSRSKALAFREWFTNRGQILEELPRGTFGVSDTQVKTKLIKLAA